MINVGEVTTVEMMDLYKYLVSYKEVIQSVRG